MLWRTKVDVSGWTAKGKWSENLSTSRYFFNVWDSDGNARCANGDVYEKYTSNSPCYWYVKPKSEAHVQRVMARRIKKIARKAQKKTLGEIKVTM